MAEISGVALSTAQGWVTRARARGLLPPEGADGPDSRRAQARGGDRGIKLFCCPSRAESTIGILARKQGEAVASACGQSH